MLCCCRVHDVHMENFRSAISTALSEKIRSAGSSRLILKSLAWLAGQPKIYCEDNWKSGKYGQYFKWILCPSAEIFIPLTCLVRSLILIEANVRLQFRDGMENLKLLLIGLLLATPLASKRVLSFDDLGQNLDSLASSSAFS